MKPILLIVVFLLVAGFGFGGGQADDLGEAQKRLRESLKSLDALILAGPKTGPVYEIYMQVRPELAANRVRFEVDRHNLAVIDGIAIEPDQTRKRFLVSLGIIQQDRRNPGFLLGYLCEGFAFLRAMIQSPQQPYQPDFIQKSYDSMDALFLHAVFLRDYAAASGKTLHPFERYLIESLQNDRASRLAPMSGAAVYVLSLDAQVLYSFAKLGGEVKRGLVAAPEYLTRAGDLVKRLNQALDGTAIKPGQATNPVSQERRYIAQVSALTMLSYGVAIINAHLANFFPKAESRYPKELKALNQSLDRLNAAGKLHMDALQYQADFLKKLGL